MSLEKISSLISTQDHVRIFTPVDLERKLLETVGLSEQLDDEQEEDLQNEIEDGISAAVLKNTRPTFHYFLTRKSDTEVELYSYETGNAIAPDGGMKLNQPLSTVSFGAARQGTLVLDAKGALVELKAEPVVAPPQVNPNPFLNTGFSYPAGTYGGFGGQTADMVAAFNSTNTPTLIKALKELVEWGGGEGFSCLLQPYVRKVKEQPQSKEQRPDYRLETINVLRPSTPIPSSPGGHEVWVSMAPDRVAFVVSYVIRPRTTYQPAWTAAQSQPEKKIMTRIYLSGEIMVAAQHIVNFYLAEDIPADAKEVKQ